MRVLVTGGAGFIGSHVCERLLGRGDEVTVLDNFNPFYDPALKRENAAGLAGARCVEGDIRDGARTLLVEDLTTDGRSKVNFCKALREAGAVVEHVFVNFYYDIFPESKKVMGELGVRLHHLATWWDVLRVVKKGNYLATAQIAEVEKFLNAPAEWSAAHGGVSSFPSG